MRSHQWQQNYSMRTDITKLIVAFGNSANEPILKKNRADWRKEVKWTVTMPVTGRTESFNLIHSLITKSYMLYSSTDHESRFNGHFKTAQFTKCRMARWPPVINSEKILNVVGYCRILSLHLNSTETTDLHSSVSIWTGNRTQELLTMKQEP
jgi:hypothetical protein